MKRSRGRGRRQQNPVNRSYDSNGPDVRVRGTASQVYEKYQALARDAMSAGDRVMAENYQQHAEHYFRILQSFQPPPSEADKDALTNDSNGELAETTNGDGTSESAGESRGESSGEPLVLLRDSEDGDEKPTKPSRRRGPLRQKKATTDEATANDEAAKDEAVIVESQASVESQAGDEASEIASISK